MVYSIIIQGDGTYFLLRWSCSCVTASLVDWDCCTRRVSFFGPRWVSAAFSRRRSACTEHSLTFIRSSYMQERSQYIVRANTEDTLYACTYMFTVHTNLVLLQFSFQAVQAIENKLLVQLVVGITNEPPNCFSFCFEILPWAQSCLKMMKKQQNNNHR